MLKDRLNRLLAGAIVLVVVCVAPIAFAEIEEPPADEVVELYEGPQVKKRVMPKYPYSARRNGEEGWVLLQYMIDPSGKPYEMSVVDSVGSPKFAKAAMDALEGFEFKPALSGGQPIDAGHHQKVTFSLQIGDEAQTGARGSFVSNFRRLVKDISAGDQAKADARFARLKVTNLYEDAFYNYAKAIYFSKWGTPQQQLGALRRAVAHEESEGYLEEAQYLGALQQRFALEVKLRDFAAAEQSAAIILKVEKDEEKKAGITKIVNQLAELRDTSETYKLYGDLGDRTSWWGSLFRHRFRVEVTKGKIAELKLRCREGYVFFRYDPELEYAVTKKQMPCGLEVLGDPGTQFALVQ